MNWQKIGVVAGAVVSILAVLAGFLTVGGLYLEWRVGVNVGRALDNLDIQTDTNIVSMKSDIQTNTSDIQANTAEIGYVRESGDRTQRQLEEVARILMQPPD